jgi:hypothetical protein
LLTFEKYQGPLAWSDAFREGMRHEEDNVAAVAKAVKAVNPDAAVLMYMHQWNYPWYAYNWDLERRPEWWAHDAQTGAEVMMSVPQFNCSDGSKDTTKPPRCAKESVHVRDWNNTEAVHGWANACARMVNAGLDGCFVDGVCDPSCAFEDGVGIGLATMQKKVEPGIVIANGAYRGEYFPGAKGTMIEAFSASDSKRGKFWTEMLQSAAQKGMLVQAHSHTCPPSEVDVAGFLVAAEENSYFGCGPWYEPVEGPQWHDIYNEPLGKPLGPADVVNNVWKRSFASGTEVTIDFNNHNASIRWADGVENGVVV